MKSQIMAAISSACCSGSVLCSLLFFFPNAILSLASDSLTIGQSLSGNQTLVSKNGTFALGFFTPGNSHKFYIGIWYNNLPVQTIIWEANRESPISNPTTSTFQISQQGNLILLNSSNHIVWSSKSISRATTAILLDTGNLVALGNDSNSESYTWQSFAYPTTTWMPGGWLGVNKITGEYQSLRSWKNPEDPAPGLFSHSMNPDGSNEFVSLWNGTHIYTGSGLWNGQYFENNPGTKESTDFNFSFIETKQRKFATYTILNPFVITRYTLDYEGQAKQWYWQSNTKNWQVVFFEPLSQCDVYALCGPYGICDSKSFEPVCRCAEGFRPASEQASALNDWSSGCSRNSLLCEHDGFLEMINMRLPANPKIFKITTAVECRDTCLKTCSCTAYTYSSVCANWNGDLLNLQQLYEDDGNGETLYLRLASSDLIMSKTSNFMVVVSVLCSLAVVGIFVIAFISLKWAKGKRKRTKIAREVEGSLVQFSYGDLQRITKNFSEKLGSGGFGSVFKGTLRDSSIQVAVKKLEGVGQGEKQFRAEVSTLGTIHHVNLVRLHGFCSQGNKRLLVYEHMPNGSLDSQLFRHSPCELNWDLRFKIILGTARGLAYLHEECRECIIHCDVKPDNVLLDADFGPKVSDFGMAKLIGRDFSKVLTTMRGTVGYLAPEWIAGVAITPKVDVYSFGMMIFEVVSGKRNIRGGEEGDNIVFYPAWAARRVVEDNVEGLLDRRLEGEADLEELTRVCRVACWCIQDLEIHRPSMGEIVQILEGALDASLPPLPTALQNMTGHQCSALFLKQRSEG